MNVTNKILQSIGKYSMSKGMEHIHSKRKIHRYLSIAGSFVAIRNYAFQISLMILPQKALYGQLHTASAFCTRYVSRLVMPTRIPIGNKEK
ncbi:hypothetical protein RhiirA4_232278 [Rhizophagus irregularis]|uniref:Uncharacterized protein n=1 Tax=Rhizophagus irregularis TaxID=588596 RepID=A0A2I1GPX8_9GLOM|nr:hypothetical protein RhiirA4_232278 [Rhizophagus irregularis]